MAQLKSLKAILLYAFVITIVCIIVLFEKSKLTSDKATSVPDQNLKVKSQKFSWQSQQETGRIEDKKSALYVYAPLDQEFLDKNFEKLKSTVRHTSIGKFQLNITQMMKTTKLDIDTSTWQLHALNGTQLTLSHLQAVTRDPDHPVPNLAHFILPFKVPVLSFHHFVCILSGYWVMKPQYMILWYSKMPTGRYWDMLKGNMTGSGWKDKVIMIRRPESNLVYGIPIAVAEHKSDVMRIEAILTLGGAYFDLDVIVLNSLEPLRRHPFTIGKELPTVVCNGVFVGSPNNTILALWHLAYQTLDDSVWGAHSLFLIGNICRMFNGTCRIEEDSLDRPGWIQFDKMFGKDRSWDWRRKNYAMHLFYRLHNVQYNMTTIRYLDNTFGDMARWILFGDSSLQKRKSVT